MGLTLHAKRRPEQFLDMGAGGFLNFRSKVAELYGEPWHSHYQTLIHKPLFLSAEESKAFFDEFNEKTSRMIRSHRLPVKLVDFCLQSDIEGRIHFGACDLLLRIIGDYDDDICYGYAGRPDCTMFRDLKALLQECVVKRCDLIWE